MASCTKSCEAGLFFIAEKNKNWKLLYVDITSGVFLKIGS